jgi:hypothetical protein
MLRRSLLRLTGLLVVWHFGAAAQPGAIVGKAADPTGNFLPLPTVRLADQSSEGRHYQTTGDRKGQFGLDGIEPGVYAVTISVQGFRDKTVPDVRVAAEVQTDIGTLLLDFAGCDAPGVICDDFGLSVYNDPIHAQGTIEVLQFCAVDWTSPRQPRLHSHQSRPVCPCRLLRSGKGEREKDANVRLRV